MSEKDKQEKMDKQNHNEHVAVNQENIVATNESKAEKTEENTRGEQDVNSNAPASDAVKKQEDIKKESEQKKPGSEKKETPENINKENSKKPKRPASVSLADKSELFKGIIDIAFACERLEKDRKKLICNDLCQETV